jgi:imidazolonepropionase-like amidohydrolase
LSKKPGSIDTAKQNVKRLSDSGVRIALGTDTIGAIPGTPPGISTIEELELLAEAGLPAAKIIEAGSRNAAEHLGLLDQLGTIEPGKIADLIIVDGDPLQDISSIHKLKVVVQA